MTNEKKVDELWKQIVEFCVEQDAKRAQEQLEIENKNKDKIHVRGAK